MLYVYKNEFGFTLSRLKQLLPNVSIPSDTKVEDDKNEIFSYEETELPSYNSLSEGIRELYPVENKQVWQVYPLPSNIVDENMRIKSSQLQLEYSSKIQQRLDSFAYKKGYDSVNSISKYQNISETSIDTLPVEDAILIRQYKREANYLALKTAQTWAVATRILNDIKEGLRPVPQSFEELELELPVLNWEDA